MIRFLILSYYLLNLSFISLLMSLVVFVLFIFSLLGKTNSLLKPRSVSSWAILVQGLVLTHLLCRSHLLLRFRNRLMIYLLPFRKVPSLLLTHIMFIIFLAFIVYLYPTLPLYPPCLLSLPLKALVRLSLIRVGNRQWLRKWMLFTPMTHRNLSLFLLASLLLVVVGFIQ